MKHIGIYVVIAVVVALLVYIFRGTPTDDRPKPDTQGG